jgi:hydrogenase 3 maturation protease
MIEELQSRIEDKNVLLLGVGNRQRGDDGVGSYLVKRLQKKVGIPLIDAGDVPENFIDQIEDAKADVVLIVDAADFGATPGEIALLELNQLKEIGASTRTANLSLLFRVIPQSRRPDTLLVAIQPGADAAGKGLSEAVRQSLDGLEAMFRRMFKK